MDKKGRIAIPAKIRKYITPEANGTLVMTRSFDGNECIDLYPKDNFQEYAEKLRKLNKFDDRNALFLRMMLEKSDECEMDGQYRVSIPQSLIEFAGLESEVLILGVLDKIEVWNPETYKKYLESSEINFSKLAKEVMKSDAENS